MKIILVISTRFSIFTLMWELNLFLILGHHLIRGQSQPHWGQVWGQHLQACRIELSHGSVLYNLNCSRSNSHSFSFSHSYLSRNGKTSKSAILCGSSKQLKVKAEFSDCSQYENYSTVTLTCNRWKLLKSWTRIWKNVRFLWSITGLVDG